MASEKQYYMGRGCTQHTQYLDPMLNQRRRRWLNIQTTLNIRCSVTLSLYNTLVIHSRHETLSHCWASVADGEPTIHQWVVHGRLYCDALLHYIFMLWHTIELLNSMGTLTLIYSPVSVYTWYSAALTAWVRTSLSRSLTFRRVKSVCVANIWFWARWLCVCCQANIQEPGRPPNNDVCLGVSSINSLAPS